MSKINIDKYQKPLFIMNSYKLNLNNNNLILTNGSNQKIKLNLNNIKYIVILTNFTITSELIKFLLIANIKIYFTDTKLNKVSIIKQPITNFEYINYVLQDKLAGIPTKKLELAFQIIQTKINNQTKYLPLSIAKQIKTLKIDKTIINNTTQLLGYEGSAAKIYFGYIFRHFDWEGRHPRLCSDPTNLLLDIGYNILQHFLVIELEFYNLAASSSFLHSNTSHSTALSSDLMEPLRPIIDNLVVNYLSSNINNTQTLFKINTKTKKYEFCNYTDYTKFTELIILELTKNQENITKIIILYIDYINSL